MSMNAENEQKPLQPGAEEYVELKQITLVPSLQPRREMDPNVAERYAEALGDGATFPPVTVFAANGSCCSPTVFTAWPRIRSPGVSRFSVWYTAAVF